MTIWYSQTGYLLGQKTRCLLSMWCLFLISGFWVALQLEPDSRGLGTHQQLGLSPCFFQEICGLPCPSCGMTTSFAHFVRVRFVESIRVNVAGFLSAVVCALQIPWIAASVFYGRLLGVERPQRLFIIVTLVVLIASLLQWIVRISQWYFM